jgi:hypothetical protein
MCIVIAYQQEYIQSFPLQQFITVLHKLQLHMKLTLIHVMNSYTWILSSIFQSLTQTQTCGIRHFHLSVLLNSGTLYLQLESNTDNTETFNALTWKQTLLHLSQKQCKYPNSLQHLKHSVPSVINSARNIPYLSEITAPCPYVTYLNSDLAEVKKWAQYGHYIKKSTNLHNKIYWKVETRQRKQRPLYEIF